MEKGGICDTSQVNMLEVEELLSGFLWIKRSQYTSVISIQPCSFKEDLREVVIDGSKYNSETFGQPEIYFF